MSRGQRLAVEIGGRVLAVLLAVYVLPSVFATDVGHFRGQASCIWYPTGKTLDMCVQRHWLIGGGAGGLLNLPYRSLAFEFPPLPLLTLPLTGRFWGSLEVSQVLFGLTMAAAELGALAYLRRSFPDDAASLTRWWTAVVLPAALIAWFRFDFLPVLFATVALVALLRGRSGAAAMTAGWLAKLWPAVMLSALAAQRRWRHLAQSAAAIAVATLAWYAWSPDGFRAFLEFRAGHGLEIESVLGALRLVALGEKPVIASGAWVVAPDAFGWFNTAMAVALVGFALVCVLRALRCGADIVALCGALTVATMVFSRIISAQYVVWMAPFVVLLAARGRRRLGYLAAGATWFTFAYLLIFDALIAKGNQLAATLMVARNICLLGVLVELFLLIRPRGDGDKNTSSIQTPDVSLG